MRIALAALLLAASGLWAESKSITVHVPGGKTTLTNVVVRVPLGDDATGFQSAMAAMGNTAIPAQITGLALNAEGKGREVVLVLPKLEAEKTAEVKVTLDSAAPKGPAFTWKDSEGTAPELHYDGKLVLAYVRPKFDPSATPAKKSPIENPTIKVYHHFYDASGTVRLTNGPEGQFPHHRGIYFGFNNISYDGKKADVWHCRNGESQQHDKFLGTESGPVLGRERLGITWNGQDGKTFAVETREITVFQMPGGRLVEFASRLTTEREKVRLDGDPQHAGFHFRANVEVEKTKAETYFLRPKGKGEKGKEENWVPKGMSGPVNLPWNAMSYVIGGKRYTTLYLDHPKNPKEARQSERTYGRIGTYFEYDLTKDKPLHVRYRLWIQEGELTSDQCESLSQAFVASPVGQVK